MELIDFTFSLSANWQKLRPYSFPFIHIHVYFYKKKNDSQGGSLSVRSFDPARPGLAPPLQYFRSYSRKTDFGSSQYIAHQLYWISVHNQQSCVMVLAKRHKWIFTTLCRSKTWTDARASSSDVGQTVDAAARARRVGERAIRENMCQTVLVLLFLYLASERLQYASHVFHID